MSIIAVKNFHVKSSLPQLMQSLTKAIHGNFEALHFIKGKICYLRLSEKLDPYQVVEKIKWGTKYNAFIPEHVPDLPLVSKKVKIPLKIRQRQAQRIPTEQSPDKVLVVTHGEILTELQSKYTGLYNLSKKTGHKLLENIAQTVFQRLKQIMETNPQGTDTGFLLSKTYRKLHPHFGDFQLILSTLHALQDAAGAPRAQIQESELTTISAEPYVIDNIPFDKVRGACNKYTDRIIRKVSEHIANLKTDMSATDGEEGIARKKVREELKKISPYLPVMIKQVISTHFIPQKSPFHRVRIYGEPFLPTKDQMSPLLKRHHSVKIVRSDRTYNMLRFNVPLVQYASLIAMDGTVIGGAKLIIRSSDIPLFKPPSSLIAEMKAVFGVEHIEGEGEQYNSNDEDWAEEVAV